MFQISSEATFREEALEEQLKILEKQRFKIEEHMSS